MHYFILAILYFEQLTWLYILIIQYVQWQHSVDQAVYYLDTRGQIEVSHAAMIVFSLSMFTILQQLWASLSPGQWESNQISVIHVLMTLYMNV